MPKRIDLSTFHLSSKIIYIVKFIHIPSYLHRVMRCHRDYQILFLNTNPLVSFRFQTFQMIPRSTYQCDRSLLHFRVLLIRFEKFWFTFFVRTKCIRNGGIWIWVPMKVSWTTIQKWTILIAIFCLCLYVWCIFYDQWFMRMIILLWYEYWFSFLSAFQKTLSI